MANPNIVNVSSIISESVQEALTTTLTNEIVAAAANTLVRVNNIIIANIDGTNTTAVSVFITKSGGSPIAICSTVDVPADATLIVTDKNSVINLQEGDNIEAGANANSDAVITVNYDILDDA